MEPSDSCLGKAIRVPVDSRKGRGAYSPRFSSCTENHNRYERPLLRNHVGRSRRKTVIRSCFPEGVCLL